LGWRARNRRNPCAQRVKLDQIAVEDTKDLGDEDFNDCVFQTNVESGGGIG
jgi:hypothetical protein